ncbi:hypothetical protein [Faecalicoccus acidiformans]|uniref:Uncharacterized protein n=1 Tax=Faecalicoccus acidiformans TaxID=915173 RepID=A0ABS2FN28_9FIRM|nr:hypothetical protein [Faecalicoccus acidiformans]MBM6831000.1 hypothetical protein [Faecalicoccus acidiformans]
MKIYKVFKQTMHVNEITAYEFKDKGKAWEFAEKHQAKVEEINRWLIFLPSHYVGTGHVSGYYDLEGDNLVHEVINKFDVIIRGLRMDSCAGYHINEARITQKDGKTYLNLNITPLGKLERPGKPVQKKVEILGVIDKDLPEPEIDLLKV